MSKNFKQQGMEGAQGAIYNLCRIIAAIAALMSAGYLYDWTFDPVAQYLYDSWQNAMLASLGAYAVVGLLVAAIYQIATATLFLALSLLSANVLMRFI